MEAGQYVLTVERAILADEAHAAMCIVDGRGPGRGMDHPEKTYARLEVVLNPALLRSCSEAGRSISMPTWRSRPRT